MIHGLGPESRKKDEGSHQLGSNSMYGSIFNPCEVTIVITKLEGISRSHLVHASAPQQDQHYLTHF